MIHQHPILPKLSHDEILEIATLAKEVEKHLYFPQEITWVIAEKKLHLISTNPVSTVPQEQRESKRRLPVARGKGVTPRIGTGIVKQIHSPSDLKNIKEHHVVVLPEVRRELFPMLKKTQGVISETGHPQTEIGSLLRQQAVPAVFSVKQATRQLRDGQVVTIHGTKGEIYKGGFL